MSCEKCKFWRDSGKDYGICTNEEIAHFIEADCDSYEFIPHKSFKCESFTASDEHRVLFDELDEEVQKKVVNVLSDEFSGALLSDIVIQALIDSGTLQITDKAIYLTISKIRVFDDKN